MGHLIAYKGSQVPSGIVNDSSLVLYLDAGLTQSYPGTGTTWTDLTTPQENGTLVNGVGYSSANQGSLVFDGADDFVRVDNFNSSNINSNFTLSIWFKLNGTNDNKGIFQMAANQTTEVPWLLLTRAGATGIRWLLINEVYTPNIPINFNSFMCASVTYFNNVWTMYLNGVQIYTVNHGINFTLQSKLHIGSGYFGYMNGVIPIFSAYNRALTPTEITQNFNALKGRYGL